VATKASTIDDTILSVNGSQANGKAVYVGGFPFNVQLIVPSGTTLGVVEISNDGQNFVVAASALGNTITAVTAMPLWARAAVASDASAVRTWQARFVIKKEA
jgi:hypothetical protein